MTDPLTATMIATLAFQEFIKSGAGELAKKFTGDAIAKMGQLRELIWSRLTGKHPAADVALEQAQAGEQAGIDTVAALWGLMTSFVSEFVIILSYMHLSHLSFNFIQSPNTEIAR